MPLEERKFTRQGEERRRKALIEAAQALMAEGGVAAATVRNIAERAGVTAGLIRHYFKTKDELTRAAYRDVMVRMIDHARDRVAGVDEGPEARLAVFVTASLRAPVVDPQAMGLWAGFLHQAQKDPDMRAVHRATYLEYRDMLQSLIADLGRQGADLRVDAIACNAVIDGLWLEGCALPDAFETDELATIGLVSVSAILGVDLRGHAPKDSET